jgi:hypothetical protein
MFIPGTGSQDNVRTSFGMHENAVNLFLQFVLSIDFPGQNFMII